MPVTLLGPADYKTMPWANGRGRTVEYHMEKQGDRLLWRFSQASVVEDGDFSVFPGVERTIMLVSGPGFHLDFGDSGSAEVIEPFTPVQFSGDWRARASGVTAPCEDMNVMTGRGLAQSAVHIHRSNTDIRLSHRTLLFAQQGEWRVDFKGDVHSVVAGQALLISEHRQGIASVHGTGLLVDVSVELV